MREPSSSPPPVDVSGSGPGTFAAGAGLAAALTALAAASCCLLPLTLAILGVGGAWLAALGPLVEHQRLIASAAVLLLAVAWLLALRPFAAGSSSGTPRRRRLPRMTSTLLAAASALTLLALARPLWEPAAVGWLWQIWIRA